MLVHDGKRGRDLGEIADAVWYPIWDSGVALDHSVRTPKEARAVADRDLKAALGLLDGRVVAGDAVLAERLLTRIRDDWRDRARNRLPGFEDLVERTPPVVRRRRATRSSPISRRDAVAAAMSPPCAPSRRVADVYVPDERLAAAVGTLFDARVALQRLAGRTDRLLLEHQDEVADCAGARRCRRADGDA